MGRTPDFSVRETTGPAGVEGEGRAASFKLPSPSLSSKKALRSQLLDLQVGPRLLERLFKRRRRLYGLLSWATRSARNENQT